MSYTSHYSSKQTTYPPIVWHSQQKIAFFWPTSPDMSRRHCDSDCLYFGTYAYLLTTDAACPSLTPHYHNPTPLWFSHCNPGIYLFVRCGTYYILLLSRRYREYRTVLPYTPSRLCPASGNVSLPLSQSPNSNLATLNLRSDTLSQDILGLARTS